MYNNEINVSLAKNSNSASPEKNKIIRGSTKQTTADRMNELAAAVRSGNIESFDELYNLGLHKAISIAMKKGVTEEEAFDIAQNTMMKLYRNIDKVDAVSTWINTTVTRNVIDVFRKKEKAKKKGFIVLELDAPMDNGMGDSHSILRSETVADTSTWVNPEAVLVRDVKAKVLKDALPHIMSLLSDRQQEVIRYALIENKSQDEIAILMGISRSTVAVHLGNARKRFQKEFAKYYDVSLFGLKSAYELETNAVSSSFLIFNAELCSALFFCFFSRSINIFRSRTFIQV